jgi:hydrogenase/urease accessory protein HupE
MRRFRLVFLAALAIASVAAITAATASAELGLLPNTTFTGKGAAGVLLTLAKAEIACKKNTIALSVESSTEKDKHGEFTIKFEGCTAFGLGMNSLGDTSGIVLTPVLWLLCFIKASTLEMGILVKLDTDVHFEVPSLKQLFAIKGSAVGTITPDAKKATAFTIEFKQKAGDQEPSECEKNGAAEKLELELEGKAPEGSGLTQKEEVTSDKEAEIMEA